MDKYDISVLVVSYHPNLRKLLMTIRSAIFQEKVSVQVVVADDGSEIDCFSKLEAFFEDRGFSDYNLVKNPCNIGTVKNCISGLQKCRGRYIKVISPGDYLLSETTLYEWISYMESKRFVMSGSDYIYYYENEDRQLVSAVRNLHPQLINLNREQLRINYLMNNDIFLGAAILSRRDIFDKYLNMLDGKVKYAEDNSYRVMMYCGESVGFYHKNTMLYEVGTGISTSANNKWKKFLDADWSATDKIMLQMDIEDKTMAKNLKKLVVLRNNSGGIAHKYLTYLSIRGLALLKFRMTFRPRLSEEHLPQDWIARLEEDMP